jgi:hypothetical protein
VTLDEVPIELDEVPVDLHEVPHEVPVDLRPKAGGGNQGPGKLRNVIE